MTPKQPSVPASAPAGRTCQLPRHGRATSKRWGQGRPELASARKSTASVRQAHADTSAETHRPCPGRVAECPRRRRASTRQLRTALVLVEELHFGRTAKRLSVTQSAISQTIEALEEGNRCAAVGENLTQVEITPATTSRRFLEMLTES